MRNSRLVAALLLILAMLAGSVLAKPETATLVLSVIPDEHIPLVLRWTGPVKFPPRLLHNDVVSATVVNPVTVLAQPITCDGDGVSGNRVQVIYARSSDVASRYGLYLDSFKQWAYQVDAIFLKSAAETGGTRRVRWVHDANCFPVVPEVVMFPTGDDYFSNTVSELSSQGYNRSDRKYVVFVDAHVYCGISDISYDDRPTSNNLNNYNAGVGRIDNGCWSGLIAAHELAHTMGAVQLSAPHSSGEFHCTDVDDLMCRPTNGTPTVQTCAFVANERLDCNHDDYFSTVTVAGSYLESHWNIANSAFLLGAPVLLPTPTPCVRGKSGKPCR